MKKLSTVELQDIASDPSGNPDTGFLFMYMKAGLLFKKDAAGVVTAIEGGGNNKQTVRAATDGALPAYTFVTDSIIADAVGALPAQDGVSLSVDEKLLVKDETGGDAPDNGLYKVVEPGDGGTPFMLQRIEEYNESADVNASDFVSIEEGTLYKGAFFKLTTPNPIVLNTTDLSFLQTGALAATAGETIAETIATKWISPSALGSWLADVLSRDLQWTGDNEWTKQIKWTGELAPAQITADQNNYSPSGLIDANVLVLTSDDHYIISGLATGAAGRMLPIINGGSFRLSLSNLSSDSVSGSQWSFAGALEEELVMEPGDIVLARYRGEPLSKWEIVARPEKFDKYISVRAIANGTVLSTGDDLGSSAFVLDDDFDGDEIVDFQVRIFDPSSSGLPEFQFHNVTKAVNILSTAATIDVGEDDSRTATTPPVINDTNNTYTAGDLLRIDCDAAGTDAEGCMIRFKLNKKKP